MAHGMIKLPLLGEVKTSYVLIGGAATAGIVGYAYYRHSKAASAAGTSASSGTDTSGYDTSGDTTDQNIDPETGYPYGSQQDTEALSQLDGGYSGDYYDPYSSDGTGTGTGTGTSTTTTTVTKDVDRYGVPNVVGATQSRAISAIKAAGLVPDPSITIPGDGNVTSQTPQAGSEVKKGSIVHWDAKAKKKTTPKAHYKSFVAAGTTSLRQAAKIRKTTPDVVIGDTEQHSPGKLVRDYIAKNNWDAKLPRGSKWYYG